MKTSIPKKRPIRSDHDLILVLLKASVSVVYYNHVMNKLALAVHGGAGTILRSTMTPELELEYRGGLEEALRVGWEILSSGGSSLDAVEATVCSLENFHLFNAGR